MGQQPGWGLLLQLLVYTSNCSGAVQYYSYYDGFKLQQQHVTETVYALSMCECFSRCKATVTCRAATFTASSADSTGQSCFLASEQWVMKPSLESAAPEAQSASLIVGHQLLAFTKIWPWVSFEEAKKKCQSNSMRLASPSDSASLEAVKDFLQPHQHSFWADLRNMDGVWKWGDGVQTPVGFWKPNQPDSSNTHAFFDVGNGFVIRATTDPNSKRQVICEA